MNKLESNKEQEKKRVTTYKLHHTYKWPKNFQGYMYNFPKTLKYTRPI
jgi:hypothetical protein